MTQPAKLIISELLRGYYLLPWQRRSGAKCYRLYDLKGNPVRNFREKTFDKLTKYIDTKKIPIFKTDPKTKRITLSRSNVRKLHGNNGIKRMLKSSIAKNVKSKIQTVPQQIGGQIQIQF